jgi:glycosyltransferase involved in cell wall biosynthesis
MLPIAGIMSEIWVKRQAETFRELEPKLITWEKHHTPAWHLNDHDRLLSTPWSPERSISSRILKKIGFDPTFNNAQTCTAFETLLQHDLPSAFICHFGWTAAKSYSFLVTHKIPYFIVFHGSDLAVPGLKGAYRKHLREAIKGAAGCIIVGSHMKQILRDIYSDLDDKKVHQIPCGAPMDDFCMHPQSNRLEHDPLKLITVGRLVNGKGIDLCLQALQLIRDRNLKIQLSIIGDGEEKSSLIEMTKSFGLEDSVAFLGHQPPEVIAEQLSSHHVFLQPSRKAKHGWIEGFGVSITEAMASALPVIASNTGGIPDQVRDGLDGFLVEIDSYKDIAECILKYEADEELRKRHGNSARTQAQCFDAKVLGHKFEDIILQNLV